MKKQYRIIVGIIIFCSVLWFGSSAMFSANVLNPFSAPSASSLILFAGGQEIILTETEVAQVLSGQALLKNGKNIEAKFLITESDGTMRFSPLMTGSASQNILDSLEGAVVKVPEQNLVWEKDARSSTRFPMTLAESQEYCENFGIRVYGKPFRVPSGDEFYTILTSTPAQIDTTLFLNSPETYWTTHSKASTPGHVYGYNFYTRNIEPRHNTKGVAFVRCVGDL
jgi:hypothetical protein